MGRLAGFKYREVARKLRALGCSYVRPGAGSHEIWRREATRRVFTVPHHTGDIPEGILRQAEIDVNDFLNA